MSTLTHDEKITGASVINGVLIYETTSGAFACECIRSHYADMIANSFTQAMQDKKRIDWYIKQKHFNRDWRANIDEDMINEQTRIT